MAEILLPYNKPEAQGRALMPDPFNLVVIEEAFGFKSVYRTFDDVGISFVAPFGKNEKDTRIIMSIDDFLAMNLAEEDREDSEHLTENEIGILIELGFTNEVVNEAISNAVDFNKLRARRK